MIIQKKQPHAQDFLEKSVQPPEHYTLQCGKSLPCEVITEKTPRLRKTRNNHLGTITLGL